MCFRCSEFMDDISTISFVAAKRSEQFFFMNIWTPTI